ncbi:MAG: tyrosine-protein phosphatase, partial [Actinomycetota bacterium]
MPPAMMPEPTTPMVSDELSAAVLTTPSVLGLGTVHPMSAVDVATLIADDRRVVPLFAVHNFRDLGGYPTSDGRETRWR